MREVLVGRWKRKKEEGAGDEKFTQDLGTQADDIVGWDLGTCGFGLAFAS